MSTNPFSVHQAYLADTTYGIGYDADTVWRMLTHTPSGHTCIICSNTAKYRLIPKHAHLATAQIQDKGFICEHCLRQGYVSPSDYGLRSLE
jgi:hypothetical protein